MEIEYRGMIFKAQKGGPGKDERPDFLSVDRAQAARGFHMTLAGYRATPLLSLPDLAADLNLGGLLVKDESRRFGLNAFKALGGSYAVAKYLVQHHNLDPGDLHFERLKAMAGAGDLPPLTFVTATDGNHGRGVAWAAQQLGQRAVVYLPRGTAQARVEAVRAHGAEAVVTEVPYDATVDMAVAASEKNGWPIVQDTYWEGYRDVPYWIMQGYTTLALEAVEQMAHLGVHRPTHVLLQAGVGSYPAAVLGFLAHWFDGRHPKTIIVEPERADCFYRSAAADDGRPHDTNQDLNTIMAGLACGRPNPLAWTITRNLADAYLALPDPVAALGVRLLAQPLGDDPRLVSGESGAVGPGLLNAVMKNPELTPLREMMELGPDSVVWCVSTEGDTDPAGWRDIVHLGRWPWPE